MSEPTIERRDSLGADEARLVWPARLIIGLVQGLLLWGLWRSLGVTDADPAVWPATVPTLFAPLVLVCSYLPVVLLGGVGRMRVRTLVIWALAASAVLALMAWYGAARRTAEDLEYAHTYISMPLAAFSAAALFIVHHLVLPADQARRWLADFDAYFDAAWKAGVQLAMSLAFTGVFWILLGLGAALFGVIGLTFLQDLIAEDWFGIPVTCLVFAVAVHLADVRDGLIRGVRSVALMLLSWLLPLMTLLAAGFLIALPFTGLDGLWETGSATSLVLTASAVLIVLINTAYQDGRADNQPPAILRASVRVAALLLTPLVLIAFWGLSMRIGQHGLTPDRIIALACAVVGAEHAAGYAFASIVGRRHGRWMQPLERTNIWGAVLAALLILALFSPLLDPARLSVNDQVGRLERGAVSAEDFDYRFLRFESGRAGTEALRRLARSDDAAIAAKAEEALANDDRWSHTEPHVEQRRITPTFELTTNSAPLPPDFSTPVANWDRRAICSGDGVCVARVVDLNGDGRAEVLVAKRGSVELWARDENGWRFQADYWAPECSYEEPETDYRERLREGVTPVESAWPSLDLGEAVPAQPRPSEDCRGFSPAQVGGESHGELRPLSH